MHLYLIRLILTFNFQIKIFDKSINEKKCEIFRLKILCLITKKVNLYDYYDHRFELHMYEINLNQT